MGVVLVLVAISVVFLFAFGLKDKFQDATSFNICKTSVIKTSLISTVKSSKNDVFSMCPSKGLGVLKENDYAVAKILLDESADCWKKFGEGKLNPDIGGLWDQEVACFSCASFQVKEKTSLTFLDNYLEIGEYDLDNAFLKSNEKNVYLINKYDENKGFKSSKDSSLKPGVWYSLINTFITDKDVLVPVYVDTYSTFSKLALIKNSDVKNVCNSVENV